MDNIIMWVCGITVTLLGLAAALWLSATLIHRATRRAIQARMGREVFVNALARELVTTSFKHKQGRANAREQIRSARKAQRKARKANRR